MATERSWAYRVAEPHGSANWRPLGDHSHRRRERAPPTPLGRAPSTLRLAAHFAGEGLPESWMEQITAPGEDEEDEQHAYLKLLTAISDYRRRHHRVGPDLLGSRPHGPGGEEWDHLTDALDLYTHARVQRRLEQMGPCTAAERCACRLSRPPWSGWTA
ncbi:hypothetical protein ACFYQA_25935 [Streptomyces sp. NPDC005774]|uniref:hypothetical protein n=1 Tax=Streptomyces sp. NPDC005774 TaxID=3364728 RepID=UPI003683D024